MYAFPRATSDVEGLQGLWTADDEIGWTYTPNWHGYRDYGWVKAEIKINSRGHRDDEPVATDAHRILLIGDSFTFGAGLDQSETIDKQIEKLTQGRIDAYNTGAIGAGPAKILELFRRCDWFRGEDVFYLFVPNDLNKSAMLKDCNTTVFNGFPVHKTDPLGHVYTTAEFQAKLAKALKPPSVVAQVRSVLLLHRLRRIASAYFYRPQGSLRNVDQGVAFTEEMQRLATERHMSFHVVIIPTKRDTVAGHYSDSTRAYLTKIRERNIPVVELLPLLSVADYLKTGGHFCPAGAENVARAIVSARGS